MTRVTLSPTEYALLRDVRAADEDRGGLGAEELTTDEYRVLARLCDLGLVEGCSEFGEAPDGEEDERDAGATVLNFRITGAGVQALAAYAS